jgi:hypothetical protein
MTILPPDPHSLAGAVELQAEEAAHEDLVIAESAGGGPIDTRAERRQARKERLHLLIRRPGFIIGVLILAVWLVCAIGGPTCHPGPATTSSARTSSGGTCSRGSWPARVTC